VAVAQRQHVGVVQVDDGARRAVEGDAAVADQDGAAAQRVDGVHRVRDEQQRGAGLAVAADAVEALLLEEHVAHGQRLVNDQDVRPHGRWPR
jgi:hypothetical protein